MAKATSFRTAVALIRAAEDALIKKAGQTSPLDRVSTLRGVYYGTPWSLDYKVESVRSMGGAHIRNLGFLTYTGATIPADPRPAFAGTTLLADLQASQSIRDRGRGIDIGHMLIGLEVRASAALRTKTFPGQGGTGLEIVTWLGDLGGGAANLAKRRILRPTGVGVIFHNRTSDYGVMDNLEGDAAGYLVACGTTPGGPPQYAPGKGIADALASYLPLASRTEWSTRAARFAQALGATVSPKGITNKTDVVDRLSEKLYEFAVWYAATRWVPSGELLGPAAEKACQHMKGAAREVATVFVATLSSAVAHAPNPIDATGPYPGQSATGPCASTLLKAASTDVGAVRKQLDSWVKDLGGLFR
ncbi:hypothetical protein ACFPM3_06280 [Streptomyces coeruleoprunus]|uniref:Uncharacterized protein n=1 Tax=Streptomyces coeruleoprunus TaxID=285563 RepID=A0ABV9XC38_9ACTN